MKYHRQAMSYAGGVAALRHLSLLCWLVVFGSVPLLIVGGLWSQSNPPKEGWRVSVPPNTILMTDSEYQQTRPVSKTNVAYALHQGYTRATPEQATEWLRDQAFTPRSGPLEFTPMGLVKLGAMGLVLGLVSTLLFHWLRSLLERRLTATATANAYATAARIAPRRVYRTGPGPFAVRVEVVDGEVVERSPQPPPPLPPSTK